MTTPAPLEVSVVYSASKYRARRKPGIHASRATGSRSYLILGVLNLIAAAALYYGVWWQADRFFYVRFIMKGNIPGLDLSQMADIFAPAIAGSPEAQPHLQPEPTPVAAPRYTGDTGNAVMGVTVFSWLTLAMLATCALGLAAGTALGRAGGPRWQHLGRLATPGLLVVLALAGYAVWAGYGTKYPPNHLRLGMGGLVLLAALLGTAIGRGVRWWTLGAAFTIILSGVGSAVGLYLATLCGLVTADELPLGVLFSSALAFVFHSFWGWLLVGITPRLVR